MLVKTKIFFIYFCILLCINLSGTEEEQNDWREWTLINPPESKRNFISERCPPGIITAVLAGEVSPKTHYLKTKWNRFNPFQHKNHEIPGAREEQFFSAYKDFVGWTLPFEDYCRKLGNRPHFLDEYHPKWDVQHQTEGKQSISENPALVPKDITLLKTKFTDNRQKAIGKFLENGFIERFLACLEHLYGNDIDDQLRACSRAGTRGKINLTKYRRPTLSDEAILQYEQREQQNKR